MAFEKKWKYPTKTGGRRKDRLLPIYNSWRKMLDRCNNSNSKDYSYYGGRGITVCDEWLSYDNFYEWAYSNGYDNTLTIDRIDVNGNYEPTNCRWVNRKTQSRNTRKNVYIDGKCLSEIAEDAGISVGLVTARYEAGYRSLEDLTVNNLSERRATRRADGKTLSQIAKESGIPVNTVRERWKRGDRTYERLSRKI